MKALAEGLAAGSRAGRIAAVGHVVGKDWASGKPKKTSLAEAGTGRFGATGSVGRKAAAAVSGLLWGWTGLHLIGISSAYGGGEVMDRYAGWLRQGAGLPLWGRWLALGAAFERAESRDSDCLTSPASTAGSCKPDREPALPMSSPGRLLVRARNKAAAMRFGDAPYP
jgi:hypothetical protein